MMAKVKFIIYLENEPVEEIVDIEIEHMSEEEKTERLFDSWAIWAFVYGDYEVLKEDEHGTV